MTSADGKRVDVPTGASNIAPVNFANSPAKTVIWMPDGTAYLVKEEFDAVREAFKDHMRVETHPFRAIVSEISKYGLVLSRVDGREAAVVFKADETFEVMLNLEAQDVADAAAKAHMELTTRYREANKQPPPITAIAASGRGCCGKV